MLWKMIEKYGDFINKYVPPFEITNEMLSKVSNIIEKIDKLDNYNRLNKMPHLRK